MIYWIFDAIEKYICFLVFIEIEKIFKRSTWIDLRKIRFSFDDRSRAITVIDA